MKKASRVFLLRSLLHVAVLFIGLAMKEVSAMSTEPDLAKMEEGRICDSPSDPAVTKPETAAIPIKSAPKEVNASMQTMQNIVKVFPDFLTKDEIEHFSMIPMDPKEADKYSGKVIVSTPLDVSLANRIRAAVGRKSVSEEDLPSTIQSQLFTRTTPRHRDLYIKSGSKSGMVDLVGFIFLNDNIEASFIYGDEVVPVVSGSLVAFRGDAEHNTIVKSGEVRIVGPFDMTFDGNSSRLIRSIVRK